MICNKDCFNCIYDDCINDEIDEVESRKYEYKKQYRETHKEQAGKYYNKLYYKRKAAGICTKCGKRPVAKTSKTLCAECLLKHRKREEECRRKRGVISKTLFEGMLLCKTCGKAPAVEGYKLCEKCLERARKALKYGREIYALTGENPYRKSIDDFWKLTKAMQMYYASEKKRRIEEYEDAVTNSAAKKEVSIMETLIKSKDRVRDFGEVFTPPHIVNEMLDMLPKETFQPGKTFLEPACGEGFFILEILKRKFANCKKRKDYTVALGSIYGMEIQADNVQICIDNIINLCKEYFKPTKAEIEMINNHIIQADSLKIMAMFNDDNLKAV